MSFVDQFAEKIRNFDPAQAPLRAAAASPDETIIGTANDDVKKIYGVRQELAKKSQELIDKHRQALLEGKHPTYCEKILVEAGSLTEQAQAANKLLWLEIYHQFPSAKSKQGIGLRANWQVVYCKTLVPDMVLVTMPKTNRRDLD